MKALGTILSAICVATVLTQGLAVAYLAVRGQISGKTLTDIRSVINGESPSQAEQSEATATGTQPSIDNVVEKRVARVWELDRRQKELAILKAMVMTRQNEVTTRQEKFGKLREQLLADLQVRDKALKDASAEQARTILARLPPADAVANLMALDLDRNVLLLKGMSERNVAALLEEFERTKDPKLVERGRKIFDAISRGDPKQSVIQTGLDQLQPAPKKKPQSPAAN